MVICGEFFFCIGFILVVVGLVVGLGNIWGFFIQVVSNGGVVFVLVYLMLVFVLVYLVFMVELIIGWVYRVNMVDLFGQIMLNLLGCLMGLWGCIIVLLILVFYVIVGGWMIVYFGELVICLVVLQVVSDWFVSYFISSNLIFCVLFLSLILYIVFGGVKVGIEWWFVCLMLILFILMGLLIVYVSF